MELNRRLPRITARDLLPIAPPDAALLDKFEKVAALNLVPFDDHAIRELATLMMTTPRYQLC